MNEDLSLDVNFLINNPAVSKAAAAVKNEIKGVDATAASASARVFKNMETLKIQMKSYQYIADNAINVTALSKYNAKVEQIGAEIGRLRNIGKAGYDELGNKLKQQLSYHDALLNRITKYQEAIRKQPNSDFGAKNIVALNKKLEQAQGELGRLQNAGKKGFDDLGNKIQNVTKTGGGFLTSLKSMGAAIGITFGISEVIAFGKQLYDIAVKASGIDRAFTRLGDQKTLAKLREETKGFVSDLDLEKLTVKAKNFNIPIDKLGGFLSFAAQRAKDTGEDVNQLTENIIDGLGRKSARIIDNLGISIVEIQKEFAKTGDFTIAVSNIIQRESAVAGSNVDTLADKTNRISTAWNNALKSVSNFFARAINPDLADDEVIGRITVIQSKVLGLERKNQTDLTEFQKRGAQARANIIRAQAGEVERKDKAFKAAQEKLARSGDNFIGSANRRADAERTVKATGEQLAISQNVLKNLKEQNIQREKQERIGRNLLSLTEMEEKVTNLKTKADNIVVGVTGTQKERESLIKEAKVLQAQIDKIRGKDDKKNSSAQISAENQYQTALEKRTSIIDKIEAAKAESVRKAKTQEEEEIDANTQKYAQLRKDLVAYNTWAANYNKTHKKKVELVDLSQIDPIRDAAEENLKAKQAVAAAEFQIEKQKQLFEQFEEYKIDFGSEKASERYGKDLKGFKTYIDYLKSLMPEGSDQSPKANALRDLLNKDLIPKAEKDASNKAFDENARNLKRLLEATRTAKTEELRINEEYDKQLATAKENLRGQELADREATLAKNRQQELEGVRQLAFQETEIAQQMAKDLFFMTGKELKAHLLKLKVSLKNDRLLSSDDPAKLTPAQRQAAREAYRNARALKNESNSTAENFEKVSSDLAQIGGAFNDLASALADTNPGLADTLATLGQISQVGSDAAGSVAAFMSGQIVTGIAKGIKAIAGVINIFKAAKESAKQARAEVAEFYETARTGEIEYQAMLRERARQQAADNASNLKALKAQYDLLKLQNSDVNTQASVLLRQLQQQKYISGQHTEKYGGFLGIGRKTKVVDDLNSLNGKSYEDIEQLFTQGKLTEGAAALFEQLRKLKEEGADVTDTLRDLGNQLNEIFTGTTADSLIDSLKQMFKEGKTTVQDFADFFKDSMSEAALSIFEDKVLRDLVSQYYDKFAESAKSDDMLTESEIADLQNLFKSLTGTASTMFEDLKKVTGLDFLNTDKVPDNSPTTLAGSFKSASQDSIDLLAGQTGGMRVAQLEGNAISRTISVSIQQQNNHLAEQHLTMLKIEVNTKKTADTIQTVDSTLKEVSGSLKNIDKKMDGNNILYANGKG